MDSAAQARQLERIARGVEQCLVAIRVRAQRERVDGEIQLAQFGGKRSVAARQRDSHIGATLTEGGQQIDERQLSAAQIRELLEAENATRHLSL